jgi:energy-coupling factor transport system permease protein
MFHTWSWVAWLVAAAVPAFTWSNPLYLLLVLGAAWIVYSALGRTSPLGSSWGAFVKVGLFFLVLTIPFNALSSHTGRIILFHLPKDWPIVGGAITLEAALAGAVNGLALLTILMVFAAFNAVVDHYQLLRAAPAFLFQAGVVASIAITFVPQMVLSAREIRAAQQIRGHRFRGLRDLLPLVLPLLASALERAIQLAETMEARGFGSVVVPPSQRLVALSQLGTLASLLALLAGLFVATYFSEWSTLGWMLASLAGISLAAISWLQGRRVQRTRYRRLRWTAQDTVLVVASAAVVAIALTVRSTAPETLSYVPYPPYPLLPPFDPLVGGALLLLAAPALLGLGSRQHASLRPEPDEARNMEDGT